MTGHQINSLVGDLVAMAQAMERLPQVEAEVTQLKGTIEFQQEQIKQHEADLNQSRSYAASLEAKVHAAEASRDDAELRFLELDEKAHNVVAWARDTQALVGQLIAEIETVPQPEPIVSEVKPIAADPTDPISNPAQYFHGGPTSQPADHSGESVGINPPQGQSEADPTLMPADHTQAGAVEPIATSWATPTPPKPQPYAGRSYFDWPTYVSYDKWIEGGGTHNDYYEPRSLNNRF